MTIYVLWSHDSFNPEIVNHIAAYTSQSEAERDKSILERIEDKQQFPTYYDIAVLDVRLDKPA